MYKIILVHSVYGVLVTVICFKPMDFEIKRKIVQTNQPKNHVKGKEDRFLKKHLQLIHKAKPYD